MKKIYTHENRMIVYNLKNVLEEEGIQCSIVNEFSAGGAGDLAAFDTWPELWVNEDKYSDKAYAILRGIIDNQSNEDWFCQGCQEKNGAAFESCWKCGRSPG